MSATDDQTIRAGPAFSPFRAAMEAAVWGWVGSVLILFPLFILFPWNENEAVLDTALGLALSLFLPGSAIINFLVAILLVTPLAKHYAADKRRWACSRTFVVGGLVGGGTLILTVVFLVANTNPWPPLPWPWTNWFVFKLIWLGVGVLTGGIAGIGASRYYERTHPE